MSASPTQRRIAGSREASTIRSRRSRRRFALERLEERTLLAGGITGFGPGWQGNGTNGGPVIAPTTLTLTDGLNDENRSAYFTTPQPIGDWNASFVYTPTEPGGIGLADGVTFILQNQALDALGNPVHLGSGLGMYQIAPSAEVEFNVYNGHTIGTNFETNGANSQNYNPTGAVNLASQDPILVELSYDGTTLTEKLTDQTTSATFSTSYTTKLPSVLGGSTAFVGFTGSTGDGISTQIISNFSFQVAGVSITKIASQPTVNNGGTETYSVSVTNSGSLGSVGTTVTDPLPAGTRFLSQTNPGAPWTETDPGLLNAGTVTFTDPGSLPSGTTANFTITVLVDSGPTRLTNTATVTSADSLPSSDTALVSVTAQTITPGPAVKINSVEGFNYVNAIVGTFTFPLPASTGTLPAGLPASDFTASIDWGDPSGDASAGTIIQDASDPSVYFITGTHTFPENGTFTVASSIRFIGGSYTTTISGIPVTISLPPSGPTAGTSATATVTQGPLAVSAFPIVGTEAKAIAAGPIATFIDAGGAGLIGDYSATISIVTPGGNTVVGPITAASITQNGNAAQYTVNAPTFTIPEEGTYQVIVAVTDSGGTTPITVTGASTAVIADAPLSVVTGVTLTPAANTGVLFTNSLVGKFTDANTTTSIPADFTAVINWGDGTATSLGTIVSTGAGAFSVEGTHAYSKFGTFTTTINVADVGGSKVTLTGTAVVTDLAPTGVPTTFTAAEGQNTGSIVLATITDPNPLATTADLTASIVNWGDGTPSTPKPLTIVRIGGTSTSTTFQVLGSHTYAEEGSALPVTLTVTTSGGVATTFTPATGTANVADAPLSSSNGAQITGVEGSPTVGPAAGTLLGTFTDANQAATVADFTAGGGSTVVNWGDGSAPQTLAASNLTKVGSPNGVIFDINASHTYAEEGTYAYTVTVTDAGGSVTTLSGSAKIADAPLTAVTGVTLTPAANTGVFFTNSLVGKFTDGNTSATTADFKAVIDWGDGSATSLGTIVSTGAGAFSVDGSHAYKKFGTYTTTVNVTDVGGSAVTLKGTAVVTDLAPTGVPTTFTAVEGQSTGTIVLATITDPNPLATAADLTASIVNWGDGTPSTPQPLAVVLVGGTSTSTIFQVVGSHTYLEEGLGLPVTLTVTTTGGVATTFTPATGTANVVDAALTSSNGTEITGIEGSPTVGPAAGTLLGTFTDSNQAATVADFTAGGGSIVVNWGDGSAPQTLAASNLTKVGSPNGVIFEINASHTYAEEGTYAYTVTVADDGGATTVISGSAIIADARLSLSPTQPTIDTIESGVFPVPAFGKPVFYNQPVASFTDANSTAPLSDFTATIDWGDGTPLSAGTITQPGTVGSPFVVTGSHTYADAGVNGGVGTYPVQVFIVDTGGSRLTVPNTANVADRPIVLTGQLNPTSDSGLSTGTVDTTNVKQPDFIGSSEAFSHVSLFAAAIGGGPLVPIGQVQAGSDGSWNAVSTVPLADGSYVITATAVDQFGITTAGPVTITSNLVIDTVGPVITNVVWNRLNGQVDYVIQDPSPGSGVDVASLLNSANYEFTKVHANKAFPGKWIVTNIGVTPGAAPLSYDVAVTFNDGATIRGGFYIFTIRDSSNGDSSVQDLAENHLDGVFYGSFPSGNGVNGSDFVAMLSGFHNKIFAPQTLVGTASAGNNGVGGPRIGAVHSGHFTPVIPRGGSPVFDANRSASKSQKVDKLHKAAKLREAARHHEKAARANHPHGPLHS